MKNVKLGAPIPYVELINLYANGSITSLREEKKRNRDADTDADANAFSAIFTANVKGNRHSSIEKDWERDARSSNVVKD